MCRVYLLGNQRLEDNHREDYAKKYCRNIFEHDYTDKDQYKAKAQCLRVILDKVPPVSVTDGWKDAPGNRHRSCCISCGEILGSLLVCSHQHR